MCFFLYIRLCEFEIKGCGGLPAVVRLKKHHFFHVTNISHAFTLSVVRYQKKRQNHYRSGICCHYSIIKIMLLHLIHTSPYTHSCIDVGSEQILKNGVHSMNLSIHLTHNTIKSHSKIS
jgi:hypothetical protein